MYSIVSFLIFFNSFLFFCLFQLSFSLLFISFFFFKGCGTFKSCTHHGIHLTATDPLDRVRNWYSFYCNADDKNDSKSGKSSSESKDESQSAYVQDCLYSNYDTISQPLVSYKCFTRYISDPIVIFIYIYFYTYTAEYVYACIYISINICILYECMHMFACFLYVIAFHVYL